MPSDERAIYLHIGPPKTGTTFLQDVLWHHRDGLARQGLTVPGRKPGLHFHAALDLRGISFGGHDNPATKDAWPRLTEATRQAGTPRVVISHEVFSGATGDEIARVAEGLSGRNLHVIVGARDLARQLPAVWQESLKNRRTRTYAEFLTNVRRVRSRKGERSTAPPGFWRAQDTVATLGRWSEVAPPDRLHVVTLPQAGAAVDSLWRRFASVIGVDARDVDLSVARPNASLGSEDAELLRRLNLALPDDLAWPSCERLVKRRFSKLANERRRGVKVLAPESYRDWLVEEAERTMVSLNAGGFDVVGDLADLRPADGSFGADDELLVPPANVTDAEVAALADDVRRQAHSRFTARSTSERGRRGGRVG